MTTTSVRFENARIGEAFQGGKIISISENGLHGLIVANQDLPGVYTFKQAVKAVKDSANYDAEGQKYTDWRLPSKDEVDVIFQHKDMLGATGQIYYSGSQTGKNTTWIEAFDYYAPNLNGYQGAEGDKTYPNSVRPVRKF